MSPFAPKKGLSDAQIRDLVDRALGEMTLQEKVAMMSGEGFFESMIASGMQWGSDLYKAGGGCERLGVPSLYFTDGPRGVARNNSTCFPATIARGASWDRDLERRIGEVMGVEARAQGCNLSGAVCVNLLRHPAWGRSQETYGEDPYLLGEMGASLAEGIQTHNVIATVKHFALNSIENTRFKVDVKVDDRTLREVYLAHFKKIIERGCASVMSAYNQVNGAYCGQSTQLLTNILRDEWGFEGFTHSDWIVGVRHTYAVSAGLDIENPEPIFFGHRLVDAVEKGHVPPADVDHACQRILRTLYRFACAEDPYEDYTPDMVAGAKHAALAREAAEKSAVLLTNSGVLPLSKNARIGVFGTLAATQNIGDYGSSNVNPPYVVTPLEGLAAYLETPALTLSGDETNPEAARAAAAAVDIAIVVVGLSGKDEGEYTPADGTMASVLPQDIVEKYAIRMAQAAAQVTDKLRNAGALGSGHGGDRDSLHLSPEHLALVKAVTSANPNTIVVLMGGGAILCEWAPEAAAILHIFYPGMEGGHALARLLFGAVSPSGKLPFSVAQQESDYPFFDKEALEVTYGPLHGYTLLASENKRPQFAFGHGLSYTRFTYRGLRLRRTQDGVEAQATIINTGDRAGEEVAQLYVGFPNIAVSRPAPLLRGFERVALAPGERKTVRFTVPKAELAYWDTPTRSWRQEPGEHTVFVGPSSETNKALSQTLML